MPDSTRGIHLLWVVLALLICVGPAGLSDAGLFENETVGERFRKAIEREAAYCRTHKIAPANRRCDITKLKPADPLATEEGRFAHSITIPNPVPADSGYRPGMSSREYFEHLCRTEAGEFIYKTVENVEGLYMMRPRDEMTYEYNHLYAMEDPYGHWNVEATEPEILFVKPSLYSFLETPVMSRTIPESKRDTMHPSLFTKSDKGSKYPRYFGYDGNDRRTMQRLYSPSLKARHGYLWRGIGRPNDRELGIAGSEMILLDLQSNEVLAVHRAYARFDVDKTIAGVAAMQWWQRCPAPSMNDAPPRHEFIRKVLKPIASVSVQQGEGNAR